MLTNCKVILKNQFYPSIVQLKIQLFRLLQICHSPLKGSSGVKFSKYALLRWCYFDKSSLKSGGGEEKCQLKCF